MAKYPDVAEGFARLDNHIGELMMRELKEHEKKGGSNGSKEN